MIWNRLGVISDEVSNDLEEALDWAVEHQLKHVEIRMVGDRNVMKLSDDELEAVRHSVERRGLFVSAIASPVFKCSLDPSRPVASGDTFGQEELSVDEHFQMLEEAFQTARKLGTNRIRIFSFWREVSPEQHTDTIVRHLQRAAQRASEEDMLLLLENEPSCNGGFASEVGYFVQQVNEPSLLVLWDPGNEAYGGRVAYPDGYESVKGHIGHVHIKDAIVENGKPQCVPVGSGSVPYLEHISRLEKEGYNGLYTIETHYIPPGGTKRDGTTQTLLGLKSMLSTGGSQ